MRKNLFTFIWFLFCVTNVFAQVWVEGKCYLEDSMDNSGTVVTFTAASPTAVTDSTYTNIQGNYQISIAQGIYDILYKHDGYFNVEVTGVNCFSPLELEKQNLIKKVGISISGSLSGTLIDTSYIVDGDIYVEVGNSLIIEPGATIYFDGEYSFQVGGYLEAVGTEFDSIKFLPSPRVTFWGGIQFQCSSNSSKLEYCHVDGSNLFGISIYSSSALIKNCVITHSNSVGIEIGHCNDVQILNCRISDNNAPGISSHGSYVIIRNCFIENNDCGIGIQDDAEILNCVISKNKGVGIGLCCTSNINIKNCTITENSESGIIYDPMNVPGTLVILNTIVKDNVEGIIFQYTESAVNISVSYNDFYNNGLNFSGDAIPEYLGNIVTTNTNGDSCDAFMNIFKDPLFVDSDNGDFYLQVESPCIDAGDPNSPLDPDGTIADIGVFYFHTGPKPTISVSSQYIYFNDTFLDSFSTMPLTINNIGTADLLLYDINVSEAAFHTDWNPEDTLITSGSSIEINVIFTPKHFDIHEGNITIYNNDHNIQIGLSGSCIPMDVDYTTSLILAGGGAEASNWDHFINNTVTSTNDAYSKLAYGRYYTDSRLFYMNPVSWQDLNGDGIDDEIVDIDIITPQNVKDAIMSLVDEPDKFYPNVIFLSGHGHVGEFDINGNAEDNLSADTLAQWIDEANLDNLTPLVVVIEACFSGSFIPALARENRIIISACRDDQFADYLNGECFSTNFWEEIWYGNNVWDAFHFAYERALVFLNGQEALLDADGNGIPNEPTDQAIAQNIYLGGQIMHGALLPEIMDYPSELEMVSGIVDVWAECNGIMDNVWFRIYPKDYSGTPPINELPFVQMTNTEGFNYSGTYVNDGFVKMGKEYIIQIKALDDMYNHAVPKTIPMTVTSLDITSEEFIPSSYYLNPAYPNPFNPTTTFKYGIPKESKVHLSIYNINGHLIQTLINEKQESGYYSIQWDASQFSSGVYIYQIQADGFSAVKKCILIK